MQHDNTAISKAIERLFPVDGTAHTARVLGLEKRSVDRMQSGYSSTPPRIVQKLERQVALKSEFEAGLEALLLSAEGAGLHPLVARYSLMDAIKSGRFDGEHEPL